MKETGCHEERREGQQQDAPAFGMRRTAEERPPDADQQSEQRTGEHAQGRCLGRDERRDDFQDEKQHRQRHSGSEPERPRERCGSGNRD